ncbi:siderophore synthetase component [Allocatelliglobosispora scoriae]|uniref:Siderophore synthetase component n=1 Tax=Allocatelliglobosispora scoriae TaxID=643052 RepID=A0A841BIG2_9ACTN|nr:IucA/IucC family protein [Allocatelliglobosispora scoriae]MBB5866959.1 siderophore synthetase component [Allocatelliglobosispora scoriae]
MTGTPDAMPDPGQTREALRVHQPDLINRYDARLPGARAAILARLWGAINREPIPGIAERRAVGSDSLITFTDGARLIGAASAAAAFAIPPDDLHLTLSRPGGGETRHTDPAVLLRALALPVPVPAERIDRFAKELANSVANLALGRADQPFHPDGTPGLLAEWAGRPGALAALEQAVVDGHPLHPGCRTRSGMSTADVLAYGPEHHPAMTLPVYEVPADRWLSSGAGLAPRLPVHPWQAEHLLAEFGHLKLTGDRIAVAPLMSLRTLASLSDPSRHYKTSIGVQMTSAVRQVSPAAVHNGPRVGALLGQLGADQGLAVCPEPAAGCVVHDGTPLGSLAVALRRVPLPGPGEVWLPPAALTARNTDGRPVLVEAVTMGYGGHPVAFWRDLVNVVVPPLLMLLGRGVGLEAHGQNLLLRLAYGRPSGLGYRDFGGLRVHAGRLRRIGLEAPKLRGDLLTTDEDALRAKVVASAFATVLSELAATLAREYDTDPDSLWRMVAVRVDEAPDPLDRAALLEAPWRMKATTAMRLAADPLTDIWTDVPNPLEAPA